MINFDDVMKENIKEHNSNWPLYAKDPYQAKYQKVQA